MEAAEILFETLRLRPRADPDDLARVWSETPAEGLWPLVDYERAAMWLMRRLTEIEADVAAPQEFVAPLRRHVTASVARNLLVDAEGAAVLAFLEREGIPCVLLKGLARRAAAAHYPCGDARSTSDVDVLVQRGDVDRAWEGLRAAGYARASDAVSPYHAPTLIGTGRVGVELHTTISPVLTPDEAWRRSNDDARTVDWNGRRVVIPAPTELLWHAAAHALHHDGPMPWRLRFFLDASCILAGDEPVVWEIIGERLDRNEIPADRAPRRWLEASAQLAGADLPPGIVQNEPAFDVVRAMRWRLNVLRDRANRGFGGRLLEEGTRRELGMGIAPRVNGTSLYKRTRRRLGGLAARAVYGVWRATGARVMRI